VFAILQHTIPLLHGGDDAGEQVNEFIKEVKFAYLATLGTDNAPRVRPLAAYTVYGDAVYFFTFRMTRKVAELTAHPQAELVWARMTDNAQVRMRGTVTLEEDAEVQARFKSAVLHCTLCESSLHQMISSNRISIG
jgi:uncharacterized pyridoxamine 5'-phosphate oxidase family protein